MTTFADFANILKPHVADTDWQNLQNLPITAITTDSRAVKSGEVFALLSVSPTIKDRAKAFITPLNSVAVLSEIAPDEMGFGDDELARLNFPIVHIKDLRLVLGDLMRAFLQAKQAVNLPQVLAVTGTNGKTTISQLVAQLLSQAGKKTAVMGTAGNGVLGERGLLDLTPSTHTTLEVVALHHHLHKWATQGVQTVALEASSHGLDQHRLQGVGVQVAIFSNLSRDHLDYHATMDEYGQAKARLFDKHYFKELTHAIINLDDPFGASLANHLAQQDNLTIWTYSLTNNQADFVVSDIRPSLTGVAFVLTTPQGQITINSPLLGLFNVANLTASLAGAMALGIPPNTLQSTVAHLYGARGRMQVVAKSKAGAVFIVDYAHTPDALEQVLKSLKAHCTGDLWAVFGCGGDRDKGKRPLMAQAGLALADKVILTSDNPRSENPNDILADMQAGMSCDDHYRTIIEPDRKTAIAHAVQHAQAGDIVVIAGKGHETYQEIKGVRYEFDDAQVVGQMVEQIGK